MIAKPSAVAAALFCLMLSRGASAMDADVGGLSCDVVSAYAATSPAYIQVFQSYLEGYLAGEQSAAKLAPGDRDAAALTPKVIAYCSSQRNATFAAAVAASLEP